jgi:RNA polymerase sigma-70 factor (ECF subfamily)
MDSVSAAPPDVPAPPADEWLRSFHKGDAAALEGLYRDHFDTVDRAVAGVLRGADRETVVHEVFLRLMTVESLRRDFVGGSLASWLRVVARNQAIDHARRRQLEGQVLDRIAAERPPPIEDRLEERAEARLTLERFRTEVLPAKWERVFVARFVEHRDQPEAARALGMRRTTLAYHEYRIRKLLHRFILRGEPR